MSDVQQLDVELLESKEFKKLKRECGETFAKEFFSKTSAELESVMVARTLEKQEAKAQMEANNAYKEALSIVQDFKGGLRDSNKRLDALINAAAKVLQSRKAAR